MSVTPIRVFGDPVLRTPAEAVVALRVFTYRVDDVVGHLVNPVLELGDELESGPEGYLSFPGILFVDRLAPEHRREAMRLIRETDWRGGPSPVIRVSRHADAFGRR